MALVVAVMAPPLACVRPEVSGVGAILLESDHAGLVEGFAWAKETALGYARHGGDPVGKWYEAALPGREAFCMRDVSHQAYGGLALGLAEHTKNMLGKFAEGVSESRDWCSFWEIDRHDRPAPVDYRSDDDFWYNLPSSFDVVQTAWRAYEWTGDEDYLADPRFLGFYRHSLVDYVRAWDRDGDGIMESPEDNGIRGIASYHEGAGPRALTGADLVAAQYAGAVAYARILSARGQADDAAVHAEAAARLREVFNATWWNDAAGRFHSSIGGDGSFNEADIPSMQIFPLYFGIVDPVRAAALFEGAIAGVNVEESSYLAEVFYGQGLDDEAFSHLMAQMDPGLSRRGYPENPYTAVGITVRFLVGLEPRASEGLLATRSRLPGAVSWIFVRRVPVLGNVVSVRHDGRAETRLTNESGPMLRWRAEILGRHAALHVRGEPVVATVRTSDAHPTVSHVVVDVGRGETVTVRVSSPGDRE